MGLFRRAKPGPSEPPQCRAVPGLAEYAARQGWRELSIPESSLDEDRYHHVAYGGVISGRPFTLECSDTVHGRDWVAAVTFPSPFFAMAAIWPRFTNVKFRNIRPVVLVLSKKALKVETGDAAFDAQFAVSVEHHGAAEALEFLSPAVRGLLQPHGDWRHGAVQAGLAFSRAVTPALSEALELLAQADAIMSVLPAGVRGDPSRLSVTFADGTTIDFSQPPEQVRAAVSRLTPEHKAQFGQELKKMSPPQRQLLVQRLQQIAADVR